MRIPQYDQTKSIEPTPTRGGPTIPMPTEASSGIGVTQEQEKLGQVAQAGIVKVGGGIIEHMQKRADERNLEIGDDRGNKLDDFATDFMYGQGTIKKTIKDDFGQDKEVEIPKAIIGRQGYDATDIGIQVKKALFDRKQIDLEALKDNPIGMKKYLERYDTIEKAAYKTALSHELTETKNGAKGSLMATVSRELNGVGAVSNMDELKVRIDTKLDTAFTSGLLTFDQAKNEKDEARDELFRRDAKTLDVSTMATRVGENYYGWSDNKRVDTALSTLNHYKELGKKQNAELQDTRNDSVVDKMLTGQLSFKDIQNELTIPEEQGGIPRKVLLKYQDGLERNIGQDLKQIVSQKTERNKPTQQARNAKQYLDAVDKFLDDKTDKWVAMEYLANAYADGIVSPQEMKILTPLKRSLDDIKFNRSNGPIVNLIKGIKDKLGTYNASDEDIALSIKKTLSEIGQGNANPDVIKTNIIQSHIKSVMPSLETITEQKQLFIDSLGNSKIAYKDKDGNIHIDNPESKKESK